MSTYVCREKEGGGCKSSDVMLDNMMDCRFTMEAPPDFCNVDAWRTDEPFFCLQYDWLTSAQKKCDQYTCSRDKIKTERRDAVFCISQFATQDECLGRAVQRSTC